MLGLFKKKAEPVRKNINGITARSVEELLGPVQHLINQIEQSVGIPDKHWRLNYLDFISNFALKVQLLPASESHHHSSYGGLLEHSLETGLNALKLRRAKMLPVGANAETIEKEKELWSFAVFTAALLHDVGKPLTDQIITLVEETSIRKFNPVTETLNIGDVYQLAFRRGRKYRSHENLPLLLASNLVPTVGLNWITSNPDILDEWTFCLTGRKEEAESIGELVTKADQISTAHNLTGGTNTTTPATKSTPLHKRLVTALTYLLDNDELPLNRQGAAGWIYDEKLWLVSKRAIDSIRAHMREEGQTGIPSDNARIMDELTQHNIINATKDDLAIWKMNVSVGSWKNTFTLLCFPLNKLWSDQSAWPTSPDNISVSPTEMPENKDKNESENDTKAIPTDSSPITTKQVKNTDENESLPSDNKFDLDLPLPPGITAPEKNLKPEHAKETPPVRDQNSNKPGSKEKTHDEPKALKSDVKETDADNISGPFFIDWLSNGIADGSITINQQQAMTHTIGDNKDLILVSPKIFRAYASKRNLDYREVQRDFQLLNIHTLNGEKNIWSFKTLTKRNNKNSGTLNGMLIKNAEEKLQIRLPPKNSHIDHS